MNDALKPFIIYSPANVIILQFANEHYAEWKVVPESINSWGGNCLLGNKSMREVGSFLHETSYNQDNGSVH